jgi:hypothetical protein
VAVALVALAGCTAATVIGQALHDQMFAKLA